jgi:hypothetical protein
MSSRKAATAKKTPARRAVARRTAAKPASKADAATTAEPSGNNGASADAVALAKHIEHGLREGRFDTLTPQAFQVLMAALCKSYAAQVEAGGDFLPLADRNSVSPTEIMMATSALLKAANLAVFELGMWQSWTGR